MRICKKSWLLPKTDSKVTLLKTSPIQFTEHGKGELVPTLSLYSFELFFLVLESIMLTTRR